MTEKALVFAARACICVALTGHFIFFLQSHVWKSETTAFSFTRDDIIDVSSKCRMGQVGRRPALLLIRVACDADCDLALRRSRFTLRAA